MIPIPWGLLSAHQPLWWSLLTLLAAVMLFVGCSAEDSRMATLRQRWMLTEEPAAVSTILEARDGVATNSNVVFAGRIADDEHEAFMPGEAAFIVTEILPVQDGHDGKEHVDNCPFCKRRAAQAPRALVKFADDSGAPLAVDARQLFGIQVGDTVVIRGKGEVLSELNLFQVTADGVFRRRSGGDL